CVRDAFGAGLDSW
nr:immunoglobulin heavy chain junction region [Macaca mulatta]MOW49853.1 immunoglobulin heavy chain junction region [Macaca mulatta]